MLLLTTIFLQNKNFPISTLKRQWLKYADPILPGICKDTLKEECAPGMDTETKLGISTNRLKRAIELRRTKGLSDVIFDDDEMQELVCKFRPAILEAEAEVLHPAGQSLQGSQDATNLTVAQPGACFSENNLTQSVGTLSTSTVASPLSQPSSSATNLSGLNDILMSSLPAPTLSTNPAPILNDSTSSAVYSPKGSTMPTTTNSIVILSTLPTLPPEEMSSVSTVVMSSGAEFDVPPVSTPTVAFVPVANEVKDSTSGNVAPVHYVNTSKSPPPKRKQDDTQTLIQSPIGPSAAKHGRVAHSSRRLNVNIDVFNVLSYI